MTICSKVPRPEQQNAVFEWDEKITFKHLILQDYSIPHSDLRDKSGAVL
jgi:hypothetical protein